MATLEAIEQALAAQISTRLSPYIEDLQVDPDGPNGNPTPPCIDVYPAEEFQLPLAYGKGNNKLFWNVRARVLGIDRQAGRRLLLSMMDLREDTSVAQAIMYDRTLGGVVSQASVLSGPTGFARFTDDGGTLNLLGCTWTVQVIP